MKKLIEVIGEDFYTASKIGKELLVGAVRGSYMPVLLNTSAEQIGDCLNRDDKFEGEKVGNIVGRYLSASLVALSIGVNAAAYDKGPEVLCTLAITNIADYGVNAYKRSRKK